MVADSSEQNRERDVKKKKVEEKRNLGLIDYPVPR